MFLSVLTQPLRIEISLKENQEAAYGFAFQAKGQGKTKSIKNSIYLDDFFVCSSKKGHFPKTLDSLKIPLIIFFFLVFAGLRSFVGHFFMIWWCFACFDLEFNSSLDTSISCPKNQIKRNMG